MAVKLRYSLLSLLILGGSISALPAAQASEPRAAAELRAPLTLASGSAMVVDLNNHQVIYASHPDIQVPIASITKLMTAMVTLDAHPNLDEVIAVDIHRTKELKGVFSRVRVGSELTRRQMLLLALMSSENRAAATLAHHYPGGYDAFIRAMNAKARALGMTRTHYVEPTGLSPDNVSSARDLVKLLQAAKGYPLIGELSTTETRSVTFTHPTYTETFNNTNHLLRNDKWDIQMTKTGFTNQAGHCLAMRTVIGGRPVALVVLDAFGKYTHFADANRLREWMLTGKSAPVPAVALSYKQQKNLGQRLAEN
ncbi:D-alanyl-D-alanine endopeptidase [Edwardsiella ictaluri]|uniref:D-alanyl-D-alanine endopeptidase, putative n=1 Tax=Edwardsiella ictaluri (strain 93-146) TaxID=634503 RepID=C5BEI7_EDWI9|nr:D-alanyl-D-alanine endopeptidase [Edwardsiella ictaluri]ACR69987.1 D-alanyl-D-alanine endopeptidase, putative [Edwardsiella ictaluri 93-146]EKS7763856.1 D-alanyl-D-alanine endopeptidase [Edwardsiella ictaluri]EKS7770638.1 D-alanyl-D-alanine endopeptidase [Edwardsiella ictaluri]EKS7773779.1 D-alanyl-D-alanine endopeptidase [Edwardsiella ictaluri]EKS7777147.1 D-alanyl-D-alanine endopeptidase [Edwardsiella ictaluri]